MTDAKEAAERIVAQFDAAPLGCGLVNLSKAVTVARAYLDLLSQPGEEEVKRMVARLSAMGLVVVPREPTGAMQVAAVDWMLGINGFKPNEAVGVWSAMLQASPKVQP